VKDQKQLKAEIENQVKRMKKAERERPNLLAQTVYIGTLGLTLVLPIVAGAYIGNWLDGLTTGYSMRWTLSLLLAGVVIGIMNVYFMVKD
jgi:ATP synthase protein I